MASNIDRNGRQLSDADFAKALVSMEDADRKTDVRKYMATSVMSDLQWTIFIELRRELSTRRLTILAGVPLTAIIDPRKFPQPEDVLWRSSVLFAVVTPAPRSAVRLLVLDNANVALERCLDRLDVPHMAYNALLNPGDFAKVILEEIDFQFQSSTSTKTLINYSENDVAESLRNSVRIIEYEQLLGQEPEKQDMRKHFESESMKLLHEVALHRICTSDLVGRLLTPAEDHIRQTSSVDILVHAPPPLGQPLLALEFDGPHHDDPRQQINDRLKDAILGHYDIPLIRISRSDAAFGRLFKDGKSEFHRRYVEGLTELVGTVVWQKKFEDDFAIRTDKAEKKLHTLEEHLANSIFGKPYLDLTDYQQRLVDDSTFCSAEEESLRFENSFYNYERDKALDRAKEESVWPLELLPYAPTPKLHGDQQTGFWADFMVSIPGRDSLEVTLPKVWIQAKSLDEELLKARVVSDLLQISANLIRQLIRMNTPATRG